MQKALQQNCRSVRILLEGGTHRLDFEFHLFSVAVPGA